MTVIISFLVASILLLWGSDSKSMESFASNNLAIAHDVAINAAHLVKEQGISVARRKFYAKGEYRFGEIYVGVIDTNGTWLVYPLNPNSEGKNIISAKDPDGKLVVQEILSIASSQCQGWVEYKWRNPENNLFKNKKTFVVCVPEQNAVVYVGTYQ